MQWLFSEQYSFEPNIATVRHWLAHFGRYLAEPPFLERRRNGEAFLDLMDGHLAERAFFLGDDFTIAGIALYAYSHVLHEGSYHLANRPHLA